MLNIEDKGLYLTLRSQGQPPFHISVPQVFQKTRYSTYHYSISYALKNHEPLGPFKSPPVQIVLGRERTGWLKSMVQCTLNAMD